MSDNASRTGGSQPAPGDDDHILMYLGPYEAWNFGAGRGYTLSMMRKYWRYISALAELGVAPLNTIQAITKIGWLPTLWTDPKNLTFIPFVAYNPLRRMPTTEELRDILRGGFQHALESYLTPPADGNIGILLDRVKESRFRAAFPIPDDAMHPDNKEPQPSEPDWHADKDLCRRIGKKRIVVVAVIDDGVPFAHRNFRDKSGTCTRVEFCWLQSVAIERGQESVRFGREYIREQIDDLIARHGGDEDTLYRKSGATADTEELGSLIDRHASHGAHVMDLATGYAAERGRPAPDGTTHDEEPREEIRIIAVQLPNTIAWDTSGFGKDMYMLSAFHYIFHRADMIAKGYGVKDLRLVINFSYGFSGGRHDGETELEAAIDELVCKRRTRPRNDPLLGPSPTALVLPAGNTFLDRLHAEIVDEDFARRGNVVELPWRIQPNDRTPSYLELWFWQGFDPTGYEILLYDPSGELRSQFKIKAPPPPSDQQRPRPGDPNSIEPVQSATHEQVGQISVDLHRSSKDRKDQNGTKGTKRTQAAKCDGNADGADGAEEDTGRYRVLVVVAPTEPEDPRLPRAGAGKWTVVIRRGVFALNDRPIHCWIQRSADPESLRSGSRQSYFDDRAYEQTRFTAEGDLSEEDAAQTFVQRFGSLNGLATGRTALVVGGYRLGSGLSSSPACARPARYSSAGVLPEEEAGELIDPVPCPDPRAYLSPWPDKRVNASSMSERSRVLPGTIAAGVRSGSLSLVQGTSSAAPFVARRLAERFVDASEMEVDDAATGNYRGLLEKYCAVAAHPAPGSDTLAPHGAPAPSCAQEDSLTRARLGKVRVPLHWQPSVEPHGCQQIVSAADYDSDNDDLLSGDAPP